MPETESMIFVFPTFRDMEHLYVNCPAFNQAYSCANLEEKWNIMSRAHLEDTGIVCARFTSDGRFTSFGDLRCYCTATTIKQVENGKFEWDVLYKDRYKIAVYRRPKPKKPISLRDTIIF